MVKCTVAYHHSAYLVTFPDGNSLLLQSDWDQASFAVSCGLVKAPDNWDGRPSGLGKAWEDCEMSDITECPDEYYEQAREQSECLGHPTTIGPIGSTVYCDGSCRKHRNS